MKNRKSQAVHVTVERNYGDQQSRIAIGQDLTAQLAEKSANVGDIFVIEYNRLQSDLNDKEEALKKQEKKPYGI
jgi:DNA helicase TIP49 (TBP-interacting protein)